MAYSATRISRDSSEARRRRRDRSFGDPKVLELQRQAGNRAVGSIVEMHAQMDAIQRESKGGSAPGESGKSPSTASKTPPDFLGPYIRAIESVQAGDRTKAGEELYRARINIAALIDESSSSDISAVGTELIQAGNIMLRYNREIQPRPLEKVAEKMQGELEEVTKLSERVTGEALKEFIE